MMGTQTFDQALGQDAQVYDTIRVDEQGDQHGDSQADQNDIPTLDLNNLKFSVKSTDMSENMILYIVEQTILAFEISRNQLFKSQQSNLKEDRNTTISQIIKSELDRHYQASWHVICGENYGSFFTHLKSHFIIYYFEGKWITIFKSG